MTKTERDKRKLLKKAAMKSQIVSDFEEKLATERTHTTAKKYKELLVMYAEKTAELDASLELKKNVNSPIRIFQKHDTSVYEATSVSRASDWHIDEIVNPRKVNNKNKFNPEVAQARVKKFFINTVKLIKKEQQDAKIYNHILWLGGDFISGNIHEELLANTSMRPIEAAILAEQLIVGGIEYILENTKLKLKIICNVGNHARITKKIHISNEQGNNLEYFTYYHIQNRFASEPRVEMDIAEGYFVIVDVYGYKQRFHHGHAIKYNNGVGGIDVPIRRSIMQWNDKEDYADDDHIAHLHQYIPHKFYTVNGSLIGYNAFAVMNKYPCETPSQAFSLIIKDRGKSGQYPIFLD